MESASFLVRSNEITKTNVFQCESKPKPRLLPKSGNATLVFTHNKKKITCKFRVDQEPDESPAVKYKLDFKKGNTNAFQVKMTTHMPARRVHMTLLETEDADDTESD